MKKTEKKQLSAKKNEKSRIFAAQNKGSLAQLVQSIALTRRGSLVRVQQFPQGKKMKFDETDSFFLFLLHQLDFFLSLQCKIKCLT